MKKRREEALKVRGSPSLSPPKQIREVSARRNKRKRGEIENRGENSRGSFESKKPQDVCTACPVFRVHEGKRCGGHTAARKRKLVSMDLMLERKEISGCGFKKLEDSEGKHGSLRRSIRKACRGGVVARGK